MSVPNTAAVVERLIEQGDEDAIERTRTALKAIIHADKRRLFNRTGAMLPPTKWPEDIMPAIVRIDPSRGKDGGYSVMFADPIRAAAQLAQIDGMYKKESKVANPIEQLLERIPRDELGKLLNGLESIAERTRTKAMKAAQEEQSRKEAEESVDDLVASQTATARI